MVKEATSEELASGTGVLESILDRESKLLIKAKEARQQGKELVSQAQKDATKISAATQKKAQARADAEVAAIDAETRKKIEELQTQFTQECDTLRKGLMQNIDKGVNFVLDLVTAPMLLPMTLQVSDGVSYVIDRVADGKSPAAQSNKGGESPC
ncbi:MAG: hypothetical protein FWD65_04710 [Coriobacteriia bacterium]|nr:hypothetical protein [Coriobacteriia bacterium]